MEDVKVKSVSSWAENLIAPASSVSRSDAGDDVDWRHCRPVQWGECHGGSPLRDSVCQKKKTFKFFFSYWAKIEPDIGLFSFFNNLQFWLLRREPLADRKAGPITDLWVPLVSHIEQQLETVAANAWNQKKVDWIVGMLKILTWATEAGEHIFSDSLLAPQPEPVILHSCHRQRLSRVEHSSGLRLI